MGFGVGRELQNACQSHVNPSVAAAPITVFVRLGEVAIGWVELIVAIPQARRGVEQRLSSAFLAASVLISCECVKLVHPVPVNVVARYSAEQCEYGHAHLYGIYPVPIVFLSGADHLVYPHFDVFHALFLRRIHEIQLQIRLSAALIVGVGVSCLVVRAAYPLVIFAPVGGIFEPVGSRLLAVHVEKSLVKYASGPYLAVSPFSAHITVGSHVGIVCHDISGHFLGVCHYGVASERVGVCVCGD